MAGLLRYALGHTLGFAHESDHPNALATTGCSTGGTGLALTAYDPYSVMNNPQCSGLRSDLVMTSLDKQGAELAYPRW